MARHVFELKPIKTDAKYIDVRNYTIRFVIIAFMCVIFFNRITHHWPKTWSIKNASPFLLLLTPLIGTIIFDICDNLIFLIGEGKVETFVTYYFTDQNAATLVVGMISTFISIFIGASVHEIMEKIVSQKLEPTPLQEGLGVLIGGTVVIIGYYMYMKISGSIANKIYTKQHPFDKNNKKNESNINSEDANDVNIIAE
jgi:hypothetical protein